MDVAASDAFAEDSATCHRGVLKMLESVLGAGMGIFRSSQFLYSIPSFILLRVSVSLLR